MARQRSAIPHYEQARITADGLPPVTPAERLRALQQRQAAVMRCVEHGTWRSSRFCESFTPWFVELAARAQRVVDVGADAGFYACLADRHLPANGRVLALEPDPQRCAVLRASFADAARVRVLQVAASAVRGPLVLTRPPGCSATLAAVDGSTFHVAAEALDRLAPRADLIKIDIEGAEAQALMGMRALLTHRRPVVFLEAHPWIDDVTPGGRTAMQDLLSAADYAWYRTDGGPVRRVQHLGGRVVLVPAECIADVVGGRAAG